MRKTGRGRRRLAARRREIMAARSPSSAAHFSPSARLSPSPEALYTRRRRDAFQRRRYRGGRKSGIIIISHLSLTFRSTNRAFIWHQKVHSHPSVRPSHRLSASGGRKMAGNRTRASPFQKPEDETLVERLFVALNPKQNSFCQTTNQIFSVFDLLVSLLPFNQRYF